MTEERKLFKDYFDREAARALAVQVARVWRGFHKERFVALATRGIEHLEFHVRVRQFSKALRETLPQPIPRALGILTRSLPPPLATTHSLDGGWRQWPLGQFIADYGTAHFDESMQAMIELTQRFTSEFALRPFLESQPQRVLRRLLKLTSHPDPHVRRWCSEGARPRLPWAKRMDALIADPSPLWPILEALRDDPDPYVRRSVGNHLNDIAKDNPGEVVALCRRWMRGAPAARRSVVARALRTLIKAGDPDALGVLGIRSPVGIVARLRVSPKEIAIGGSVECRATLRNRSEVPIELLVDYAVLYVRKQAGAGRKVFKWTRLTLDPGGRATLIKSHPMKRVTTRALYPGRHKVELQINGRTLATAAFVLAFPAGDSST